MWFKCFDKSWKNNIWGISGSACSQAQCSQPLKLLIYTHLWWAQLDLPLSDNFRATGPRCTECRRFDTTILFTQTARWNHLGEFFQNVLICRLYPRISGSFDELNNICVLRVYLKTLGSSGDLLKVNMLWLFPRIWEAAGDLCKVPVPGLYPQNSSFIIFGQSSNSGTFSSVSYAELLYKNKTTMFLNLR